MPFEIAGIFCGQTLRQTRERPAPALLMAERWTQSGVEGVQITWNGRRFDPETFRNQFVLTSAGLKPRKPADIAALAARSQEDGTAARNV